VQLADGRIYTGEEAVRIGLIDQLGGYEAAVKATAELAGIKGEPTIVTPPKPRGPTLLDLLTTSDLGGVVTSGGRLQPPSSGLEFQYIWK
jgi:protease-4